MDADIEGAFDNISHDKLLEIIGKFPAKELIRQWLKAGYVDEGFLHGTETGTPQGGVISPLLANIALHGMEDALGIRYNKRGETVGRRAIVRYADDFVVFCESREDAEATRQDIRDWLATRGLQLSESKTRIVHLTEGFDFLGFNIRHYRAPQTSRSGYKLLIKPSKESVQEFRNRLKQEWMSLKGHNVHAVIRRLNPILRGWANYFKVGVAKDTFSSLDYWMFRRCIRYTKFTHPTKSWRWRKTRYWGELNSRRKDKWVFGDKSTGNGYLLKFSWTPIERHVLVKGTASPDDPELKEYWINRQRRKIEDLPTNQRWLARSQKGRCTHCRSSLFNGEALHIHHLYPGGTDEREHLENLRLLHYFCHQQLHRKMEWTKDAWRFA